MLQSNRQYFLIIFFLSSLISFSQGTVGEVKIIDEDQLPKWVKVEKIEIVNNKITRPWVILNQFEYQVGDSLQRYDFISKTLQSRKNLVNRQLFTYIDFKVETVEEYKVILTVTVKERWNIWPAPIIQIDAPNINEFFERKDWSRLSYGASLGWSNFFGTGHKLKLRMVFGNSNQINASYEIPALSKKVYLGLIPHFEYKGLRTVNYKSSDDSQELFQLSNQRAYESIKYGIDLKFKHSFYMQHQLKLGYEAHRIKDTLLATNPTYLTMDTLSGVRYYTIGYQLEFDKADSKTYPLKGYSVHVGVDKYGIGLVRKGNIDVFYLNAEIAGYVPIGAGFYWGGKARVRLTPSRLQPYIFRNGLGYDKVDYLRGYELYSIEGTFYSYFNTNFKFQALNKTWIFVKKKKPEKEKKKKNDKSTIDVFKNREKKNYFPLGIY
ncbi:MAG: BamA/TamA family outer membrane protein, partial [Flavobacteriaceae bacterium]|nr:BamA/TamA family outer membrane protein [Flavobacteriaceae bacterium]